MEVEEVEKPKTKKAPAKNVATSKAEPKTPSTTSKRKQPPTGERLTLQFLTSADVAASRKKARSPRRHG